MTHPPFDLTGKKVLVTGGNSGIGLAMADALAGAGANVCIWGSSEQKNSRASEKLKRHGAEILSLQCDVSVEKDVENAFSKTLTTFGQIDACFANAGVGGKANSFVEMTTDEWRRVMSVNLDGAFFTLRAAARHMCAHDNGGSLVATASLAAVEGQASGQHYAATKGGLISMMRSLAVGLARHHVRANSILPGWIDTDMTHEWLQRDTVNKHLLRRIPARRWGQPIDFGPIAIYLVSDASAYHTGDTFIIDGGYSLF